MPRRLFVAIITPVLLVAAACSGGSDTASENGVEDTAAEETAGASGPVVRIDYQHDEFAGYYWRFLPRPVKARPGDTITFRQTWTGEPHTVTFGEQGQDAMDAVERLDDEYVHLDENSPPALVEEAHQKFLDATKGLPLFSGYPGLPRLLSQPCFLRTGTPPIEADAACPEQSAEQPPLDRDFVYYSSGVIPPVGPSANEFQVKLADDAKQGTYRYYCAIHFPYMQGKLTVLPRASKLPSQRGLDDQARAEVSEIEQPLRRAYADAKAGRAELGGVSLPLPLAGHYAEPEFTVKITEFFPQTVEASVGKPVTWTFVGAHTLSFGAPTGLAPYAVDADGTVRRDPRVDAPAGGSPAPPPLSFDLPRLAAPSRFKEAVKVDGGTWNGEGFFSSGVIGAEPYATYTLRVSKPGRYPFACLIHPKMKGTLNVASD